MMAVGRRESRRREMLESWACNGDDGKRYDVERFLKTGAVAKFQRVNPNDIPLTPQIAAEMERLKAHEERLRHGKR